MTWPLVIVLVLIVILMSAALASAAPWLPTWQKDIGRILELADLKPGQEFYDLGCGDGRLICAAAKNGVQATGLELSVFPYLLGQIRIMTTSSPARIRFGDLFRSDLAKADVVYLFLTPPVMAKVKAKLWAELKPGAKVISYHFALPEWPPTRVDARPDQSTIYLYTKS